jgi:hypothetical protein
MKNHFSLLLLAFFALSFAACNLSTKQDNSQLLSSLERSNVILSRNNKIFLNNLNDITTVKTNYTPLAEIANKINGKSADFGQNIVNALQNATATAIDYPALFGKYAALCELTKSELLTLQQDAQAGKIAGVVIRPQSLNDFFSNSPLVGKAQKPLSKEEFDKLEGENLKAYLTGLKLDAISGTNEVILFLRDNINNPELDNPLSYNIMSVSPKAGILLGEEFVAEISVAAYSSATPYHAISVNGTALPTIDGKAIYKSKPNKIGTQSYTVNTSLTNPTTGEVIKSSKEFMYEVAVPMAYIETASSHVLYVGQDNLITIYASGISSGDIGITAAGTAGLSLISSGVVSNSKYKYIVKVARQGTASIKMTDKKIGKIICEYPFTVK